MRYANVLICVEFVHGIFMGSNDKYKQVVTIFVV